MGTFQIIILAVLIGVLICTWTIVKQLDRVNERLGRIQDILGRMVKKDEIDASA